MSPVTPTPDNGIDREFLELVVERVERANPELRHGQTVFNVARILMPRAAAMMRGTPLDCFYDDAKAARFIDTLFQLDFPEGAS